MSMSVKKSYARKDFLTEVEATVHAHFDVWCRHSTTFSAYYQAALSAVRGVLEQQLHQDEQIDCPVELEADVIDTMRRGLQESVQSSVPSMCLADILRVLGQQHLVKAPRLRIVLSTSRRLVANSSYERLVLWSELDEITRYCWTRTRAVRSQREICPASESDRKRLIEDHHEMVCSALLILMAEGLVVRDTLARHVLGVLLTDVDVASGVIHIPIGGVKPAGIARAGTQTDRAAQARPTMRIYLGVRAQLIVNRLLLFHRKWGPLLGHPPSDPYLFPERYRQDRTLFAGWLHQLIEDVRH